MLFYTLILMMTASFALLAKKHQKNKKANLFFVFLIIIILTLVSGLRYRVGTDYGNYIDIYHLDSTKNFFEIITGSEPLFNLIVWLSSRFIYEPQIMFFIVAAMTVSLIVLGIRKYSNNFPFSIFLYLTTFSYFSSMNGIRQWLAVAILFYFFDLILEKKILKFILTVGIASLIHTSAVFMVPVYFIIHKKHTMRFVLICLVFAGILFVFYPLIDNILAQFLGEYGNYLTDSTGYASQGVKGIRIIIPIIIYTVSLFYLGKNIHNKKINSILNLVFVGVLIATLGLYSKIFFRMITYFSIYEILIIPLFFACIGRREKMLAGLILVVSFYAYVNVLWRVDSNVLPYQTVIERK